MVLSTAGFLEGFYGHNVLPARRACQHAAQSGDLTYNSVSVWKSNVQAVAFAAQANPPVPVFPTIPQAGCKSPSLEGQPSSVRDKFETAGYASFLLAVEDPEGPVSFGINSMYRENRTAEPYAKVHERFSWPLGKPVESYPPGEFDKYQYGNVSYGRRFANGFVIYNPSPNVSENRVQLPGAPYVDPETNQTVNEVDLAPHTARIVLKSLFLWL